MIAKNVVAVVVGVVSMGAALPPAYAQEKPPVVVEIPKSGVPQIMTLEGKFVRVAYNNEAYVILGYQATNRSVGDEWMLLEVGAALMDGVKDYKLTRAAISLDTTDGKNVPLPSVSEFREGNPQAIQQRAKVQRDSINYFPVMASQPCRIGFFTDLEQRAMPWDEVEMTDRRACVGRFYFKVPGGIQYGQYWLNVKFENSLIRVPFKVLTKDEEKLLSKNYKSIEKQVKEAFAPKKK